MMVFIQANLGNILVLAIVVGIVTLIIRRRILDSKAGKSSCSSCSACAAAPLCKSKSIQKINK